MFCQTVPGQGRGLTNALPVMDDRLLPTILGRLATEPRRLARERVERSCYSPKVTCLNVANLS